MKDINGLASEQLAGKGGWAHRGASFSEKVTLEGRPEGLKGVREEHFMEVLTGNKPGRFKKQKARQCGQGLENQGNVFSEGTMEAANNQLMRDLVGHGPGFGFYCKDQRKQLECYKQGRG